VKRPQQPLGLVLFGTLLGVLFVLCGVSLPPLLSRGKVQAAAGINKQISFQGKVTNPNGTNVANGSYGFVFKLYTGASGGVATWTESDTLTVTDGVFQVNLGAVTTLPGSVDFNSDNIYLGITFNSDPAGEMAPRIQLTASPYAFNADKLDGLDSTGFVQIAPAAAQTDASTNSSIFVNKTGASGNLMEIQQGGNDALLLDFSGRLGIGVSSNTAKLNVVTGGFVTARFNQTGSNDILDLQNGGNNVVQFTSTGEQQFSAADHTINVLAAGAGANGNSLTIQAGNGTASAGSNQSGGNLILQGGNRTGTGAAGAVVVKPQSNDIAIFQVQNVAGTSIFIVDTINNKIGTAATFAPSTNSTDVKLYSGDAGGTTSDSGSISIDVGTATRNTGSISIGTVSASTVTVGRASSAATLTLQGGASTSLSATSATGTTKLAFVSPSTAGTVTFNLPAGGTGGNSYNVCTTLSVCSGYLSSSTNAYVQLAPGSAQTDNTFNNSIFVNKTGTGGDLLRLQNTGTNLMILDYAGNLSIGTTSNTARLNVTSLASSTPAAIINQAGTGLVLDLQTSGASVLNVSAAGNISFGNAASHSISVATSSSANGFNLTLQAGSGNGTDKNGGNIVLQGGAATGLGTGGSVIVKPQSDSLAAFVVQDSSGNALLSVDTSNARVIVGSTTTDPNAKLFVVDSYDQASDPAGGTNGAIYYNTSLQRFRCYENGAWQYCVNTTLNMSNSSMANFVSGIANVAAGATGTNVETMVFTSATAVSATAGVTGFTAPSSGSFRTCMMKNNAAITAGSVSLRWRVNGASVGSNACTLDTTNTRQNAFSLDSGTVTFNAGDTIGLAIDSTAGLLPSGTDDLTVYWSVEYNSSTGTGISLQYVYDQSTSPAAITTTDAKNIAFNLANTATDASFLVNMQCGGSCSASGGKFAVQTSGTDVFTVNPSDGSVVAKGSAASTSAFQVQNNSGNSEFTVDTTNHQVLLGKAGTLNGQLTFATSTGANTFSLAAGATSTSYSLLFPTAGGSANQCLTLGGAGGSQLQWGACGTASTGLAKNAADSSSASVSAASFLYQFTNSGSAATGGVMKLDNGTNTGSAIQIVGTGNSGANNAYIFAKNSNASPSGNILDLQNNVSAGTHLFSVSATGAVSQRVTTDSTTAFLMADANNNAIMTVDTTNTKITLGSKDANTPVQLVLGARTNSGDPTGSNGAMYYNSSTNTFRCYENGAWADCLSHHVVVLGSDQTNNNATACTIADVTGLSFAVTSGTTYRFHATINYTSAATGTGSRWSINGPTTSLLSYTSSYSLTTTTQTLNYATAYDTPAGCSATSAATAGNLAILEGVIKPSANGTVTVRFASEVSGSAVIAKAGSTIEWW
jgi:hypothetical protein